MIPSLNQYPLILEDRDSFNNLNLESFPEVDDFSISFRDTGMFGKHIDFNSKVHGKIAGFPWWDHADYDLRKTDPKNSNSFIGVSELFDDLDQCWRIVIFSDKSYIYILQTGEEFGKSFDTWFKVKKELYISEWSKLIIDAHENATVYKTVDEAMQNVSKVKTLLIWWNDVTQENIEKIHLLRNLESLKIKTGSIKSIPCSFSALKHLKSLELDDLKINSLPETLKELKNLEELSLHNNCFTEIPEVVFHLKSLKKLSLGRNLLSIIPEKISELTNLEVLDLSDNEKVKNLPSTINKLNNLKTVYLSKTGINEKQLKLFSTKTRVYR